MEAYVIQTDKGILMFDSPVAAKAWGDGLKNAAGEPRCWHDPVAVTKEKHYRGKINGRGVLFTAEDQSYG